MRMGSIRWVTSLLALGALVMSSPVAADMRDADAVRIAAAGHSLDWTWTPPGRTERFGHGETLVHAPLAQVRKTVQDFGRYKDLGPDIKTSRVVGREPDGSTDVYIRIAVLNDLISFWNVTRFAPLREEPGVEIIEGHMVPGKGNIDDSVVKWTMHSAGDDWTVLKFDALLRPGVPAPQSLIDNTLRESAVHTVESVRDRLQDKSGVQPYTG
jgi:carbon monoxide dehydrogenase subunit G